jgi:hypothetical protein
MRSRVNWCSRAKARSAMRPALVRPGRAGRRRGSGEATPRRRVRRAGVHHRAAASRTGRPAPTGHRRCPGGAGRGRRRSRGAGPARAVGHHGAAYGLGRSIDRGRRRNQSWSGCSRGVDAEREVGGLPCLGALPVSSVGCQVPSADCRSNVASGAHPARQPGRRLSRARMSRAPTSVLDKQEGSASKPADPHARSELDRS